MRPMAAGTGYKQSQASRHGPLTKAQQPLSFSEDRAHIPQHLLKPRNPGRG